MPVVETSNQVTARSALRHRPIGDDADQQEQHASAMTGITPVAQRALRLHVRQTEEDHTATPDRTLPAPRLRRKGSKGKGRVRGHPLLYLGIGMIAMLALWTLLTIAVSWWNTTWDDIHYGRPRTFQTDAVVGHNDSQANPSHFIAINLNARIEIIEFPGGDASRARIYLGPQLYGAGSDLVPVTLSFVDVNGNHLPDMIVPFQNTHIVFINDQGGFRPARPDELHAGERYLQQHGQ